MNILDSIAKIKLYSCSFKDADSLYSDSRSFDAVMMNFVIIGEMADKLTDEVKHSTESMVDWFQIKGFRNIIAHNYFGIDAEEVWQIIQTSLSDLEIAIKSMLEE